MLVRAGPLLHLPPLTHPDLLCLAISLAADNAGALLHKRHRTIFNAIYNNRVTLRAAAIETLANTASLIKVGVADSIAGFREQMH